MRCPECNARNLAEHCQPPGPGCDLFRCQNPECEALVARDGSRHSEPRGRTQRPGRFPSKRPDLTGTFKDRGSYDQDVGGPQ